MNSHGAIRAYERPLAAQLIAGLREIPDVAVYGITDRTRFDRRLHAVGIRTAPGGRTAGQEGTSLCGTKALHAGRHRAADDVLAGPGRRAGHRRHHALRAASNQAAYVE
jgi:hypothetical protein